MQPGTLVRITEPGPWGTLESIHDHRFAPETVFAGDGGEYVGPHPELDKWHVLKFDTVYGIRYAPMYEGSFKAQSDE